MKFIFGVLRYLFIIAVLFIGGIILYGTLTEYKPEPGLVENIEINGNANTSADSSISILNWNIGFGGLGAEMDFFYDGGDMVRASREQWNGHMDGIVNTLLESHEIDVYMLQEVDQHSKRSYYINQFDSIGKTLPNFQSAFGLNYNVQHVPLPFTNPMGKVFSGVATYSKFPILGATRHQYPGAFAWPTRIFFLDRCFLTVRIEYGEHEIVLINTHNSAYDKTGELKAEEMAMLKEYVVNEYNNGNYVIVGGDFNQCPPDFNPETFVVDKYEGFIPPAMPQGYIPEGWQVAYDASYPTNRHLNTPYNQKSFTTLIDFYFVSPNIRVEQVETLNLDFAFSDHQPVLLKVQIM